MSKPTPPAAEDYGIERQYFPAKANPMFSPLMTACIKFVRFAAPVPCMCCGRRSKHHWTAIVRFKVADMRKQFLVLKFPRQWLPKGSPVCRNHILKPDKKEMLRLLREFKAAQKP